MQRQTITKLLVLYLKSPVLEGPATILRIAGLYCAPDRSYKLRPSGV